MRKSLLAMLCVSLFVFMGNADIQKIPKIDLDVPYVPTPYEVVAVMLRMVDVKKDDVLYDLGCGDGRIVITAAKEAGCRGVGIDIDSDRIKESREGAVEAGVEDRVRFLQQDLFETDFKEASVMTLYLLSSVNLKLRPKLLRELRPGSRIVSHDFSMGKWEADKIDHVRSFYQVHTVYLWTVPANVTGTWEWTLPLDKGKTRYVLELDQRFQKVSGKYFLNDKEKPQYYIIDVELKGDTLKFTIKNESKGEIESLFFEGQVRGNYIEGSVKSDANPMGEKMRWRAKRDPSTVTSIDSTDETIWELKRGFDLHQ